MSKTYFPISLFSFLFALPFFLFSQEVSSEPFFRIALFSSFAAGKTFAFFFRGELFPSFPVTQKEKLLPALRSALLGSVSWAFFLFLWGAGGEVRTLVLAECLFFFLFFSSYLIFVQNGMGEKDQRKNVLVVGAGDSGARLIKEIASKRELGLQVLGFVDDNPNLAGLTICGVPVLGTRRDIPHIVRERHIEKILIAIPSASEKQMKEIVLFCAHSGVPYQTVPAEDELINDEVNLGVIRDVSLEDLLCRKAVEVEPREIEKTIKGQRVMITGAGGSIGSELARQVMRFKPEAVILFERNEANLYELERSLKRDFPEASLIPAIGDVTDELDVRKVLETHRPSLVYHAAAYKHVPMMEQNVCQAVRNNVLGTRNLLLLSEEHGVERFVNISTDKVVNATSVMGISKRVAELILKDFAQESRTKFMTVRFGNVLGSRGSVIPLFQEQIRKGEPVTVTHPDVTRYFMTIREAAQLVMLAGAMGKGGETFILEMGKPIKILNLAKNLISLSGRTDIQIKFIGLRPGEKMVEELWAPGEKKKPTAYENILLAHSYESQPSRNPGFLIRELIEQVQEQREQEVISLLTQIVPDAKLSCRGHQKKEKNELVT
jgi:FlaA1/EpsC-like NDP-sugar epimerase